MAVRDGDGHPEGPKGGGLLDALSSQAGHHSHPSSHSPAGLAAVGACTPEGTEAGPRLEAG
eukprot:jgi/Mesvir1/1115/Mv25696-RA.1